MSALFIAINVIVGLVLTYIIISNVLKLFIFTKHPQHEDVTIAEGMMGALYRQAGNDSGWSHKSSVVRLRLVTTSQFTGAILRTSEVLGGTHKPSFANTGDSEFDAVLALHKPSANMQDMFKVNPELRTTVYAYMVANSNVLQLSFAPGFIEVNLINDGDRVSDNEQRLVEVTGCHVKQLREVRASIK